MRSAYRTYLVIVLITLSVLSIFGCLSEIEIDLPENSVDNIVIVSQLSKGEPSQIEVRISALTSFVGVEDPIALENADVSLVNENGNSELIPHVGNGEYNAPIKNLAINAGESYQLVVELDGSRYESDFEKLTAVPEAINIEHTEIIRSELNDAGNIVDGRYLQFFINTPLTSPRTDEKVYLKWDFTGVYKFVETTEDSAFPPVTKTCYISQILNLDKIAIYNGPESRETLLEREFIIEEALDARFARGFYLTVFQQTLSQRAFEYWEQIKTITDLSGNFFEDPPGKIFGNFKNVNDPNDEVFGFFYATQTDTIRVHVAAETYENVFPVCPGTGSPMDETIRFSCFDCLREINSTTTKPSYWIE